MWSLKDSVAAWAERARAHGVLVLYPEAAGSTWDYISSRHTSRRDVDFLQFAMNRARSAFRVDDRRIAVLGISDGGSMALSLAAHNAGVFQAGMSISAGFCASPPPCVGGSPKLFMKHGAQDRMFPLERVGYSLRDRLKAAGYSVEHRIGHGEGHVPSGWQVEFLPAWLALQPKR